MDLIKPFRQLLDAGAPTDHIISEVKSYLIDLEALSDTVPEKFDAIKACQEFIQKYDFDSCYFNGYVVEYWSHETQMWETMSFRTKQDILNRKFDPEDGFPDPEDFAENLFEVYGDRVKFIKDLDGNILYDNSNEIDRLTRQNYFDDSIEGNLI
jgi:hypothetical protein